MLIITLRLLAATLGVSAVIAAAFNLLKIKRKAGLDWDGIMERLFLVLFFSIGGPYLFALPAVILLRVAYHLSAHFKPYLLEEGEPAIDFQRAVYKTEILLELVLSPALAILVCLVL